MYQVLFVSGLFFSTNLLESEKISQEAQPRSMQLNAWVKQLGDASFVKREAATQHLIQAKLLGLEQVLEILDHPDREMKSRARYIVSQILQSFASSAELSERQLGFTKLKQLNLKEKGACSQVALDILKKLCVSPDPQTMKPALLTLDELIESGSAHTSYAAKKFLKNELSDLFQLSNSLPHLQPDHSIAEMLEILPTLARLNISEAKDRTLALLRDHQNLKYLTVYSQNVTDQGLKHLEEVNHLVILDLYNSSVSDRGLKYLRNLTQLKRLVLSGTVNKVTGKGFRHLKPLSQLRHLNLYGSAFTNAGMVHLRHFKQLEYLSLVQTQIGDQGLKQIQGLKELRSLYLYGTKITSLGLAHLQGMTHLKELWLGQTAIDDHGLKSLSTLNELQYLSLNQTFVGDSGLHFLKNLRKLNLLYLDGTGISDQGFKQLAGLKNLQKLGLSQTKISDSSLEVLKSFPELKWLNIRNTKLSAQAEAELRAAKPQLKIY